MATKKNPHREMLAARKKRDQQIIRRAANGDTQQDIADDLGMTRQRVGQIIARHAAAEAAKAGT